MKAPGPMSSLENLNQRASEQENIIISNQERKTEVLNPGHGLNGIGDAHMKRQRKTSQGNRGRFENLTSEQFQQQNFSQSSNNLGQENLQTAGNLPSNTN
jgi:hypothetical protein